MKTDNCRETREITAGQPKEEQRSATEMKPNRKGISNSNNHGELQKEQEHIMDQQAKPRRNPKGERRRR